MNGAEFLIQTLELEGVDVVFGYPGGTIMPVYDALLGASLQHILVRHEQGAALAADGYARSSGKVGVCMATSGPGVTNLITGIANAKLDSVPIVAITGQVPTALLGTDAFQEVDTLGMSMPVVKHSYLPRSAAELAWMLPEAFRIAQEGRPGPVLVDLPKDVALAEVEPLQKPPVAETDRCYYRREDLARARELLSKARRPMVYAGGGVGIGGAVEAFRRFVRSNRLPVVCTLMGLGAIPGTDPHSLGMLGMHGLERANHAVQECDLLLAIGARFDDRVTGKLDRFAPDAAVIHLDIDAAELGKLRRPGVALQGPIPPALEALEGCTDAGEWLGACQGREQWKSEFLGIDAPALIRGLSERTPVGTIIACDVGQHQMWVAQHYAFEYPEQHLTSGGLGAMGYGIPAAIGAQLAHPNRTVVTLTGDGSVMMNIQELATIRRYQLPIKIVLLDNSCLGMVRQWQDLFFDNRQSEVDLSDNPDFLALAACFDIPGERVIDNAGVGSAMDRLLSTAGPYLVHVRMDSEASCWPLVPPGKANHQMLLGRKS